MSDYKETDKTIVSIFKIMEQGDKKRESLRLKNRRDFISSNRSCNRTKEI